MSVNFSQFNNWGQMLAQCLNGNETVAYLYTNGKEIHRVPVKDAPPSGFKKMSLDELISESLVGCLFQDNKVFFRQMSHQDWVRTQIIILVDVHNLFDNDYPFENLIQEIRALPNTCDSMHQTLFAMCEKARMKRTAQKVDGVWSGFLYIWSQLKYFLWNCFYNPSSRLKGLKESCANLAAAVQKALQEVPGILNDRVQINIDGFLEEVGINNSIEIQNSKDINTKFLAKYHSDKYSYDSILSEKAKTQADTYRQRIIVIKNVWDQFEKPTLAASSVPASTPIQLLSQ